MNYEDFQPEGEKPEGIREKVIRHAWGTHSEMRFTAGNGKMSKLNGALVSIAIVAWFVASIALMLYAFKQRGDIALGIATFGQVFLVFGVIALCAKEELGILFAFVGGALCTGGLVYRFAGDPEIQKMLANSGLPMTFLVTGLGMFAYAYLLIRRKKRCTLSTMAQSTYLDQEVIRVHRSRRGSNVSTLMPMWVKYYRYCHNGRYYYCDCIAIPASQPKPSLGDYREIFINPDNPEEYWSKASGHYEALTMTAIGLLWTIIGGVAFCVSIQNL